MSCAACGHANPADSSFCEACGAGLERSCAACGAPASPGARFCRKCGVPFEGASPEAPKPALLLDDTYRDVLPTLFEFLGIPDPERPAPPLPPEARQRRLFAVLRRLTQGGGATGEEAGVIWFEDLHWIDAASEVWLAEWVAATLGSRTVLLLNFRPEYHAAWMQRAHYQQLALAPLSAEGIQELLVDLIGSHPARCWPRPPQAS